MENMEHELQRLRSTWVHKDHPAVEALNPKLKSPISKEVNLEDLLKRPEVTYPNLMSVDSLGPGLSDQQAAEQVEIQTKYAGYIARQHDEIAKALRHEHTLIPRDFDYARISGLSNEVIAKLSEHRPQTVGQAGRISGITPAAISMLLVHLKKQGLLRKQSA